MSAESTQDRPQTLGEEIANSVSHGVGLVAACVGLPFLIRREVYRHSARLLTGVSIFAATVIFLYLISTLYHALPRGRAKKIFQIIEHGAIYLLIAGTYTPFTLGVLHGPLGWTMFGLVWGFTAMGIILKAVGQLKSPLLSTAPYLALGWLILFSVRGLWYGMPHVGFLLIILGGLAYSLGVIFYLTDHRWRYSHFIWHLFVLAGTTLHYFAILWYSA